MYECSVYQHRLRGMQRGHIRPLEELSNRDFVAPDDRAFDRRLPFAGVVGRVVFELFHSRPEPLVGIVMVVSDAWAEDIDEGEAFVLDALLDEVGEVLLFAAES